MYFISHVRDGKEIFNAPYCFAISDYVFEELYLDEPILRMYTNDPAVIIGKNQNAYAEVNLNYLDEHQIDLVRRNAGGGAVYHDHGTIVFSLITNQQVESYKDFGHLSQPILDVLHRFGASGAGFGGRNDLLIDGKKFSGMTMISKGNRSLVAGTLLLDVDQERLDKILTPNKEKLQSKGVKSVASRVTAIRPYLDSRFNSMNILEFREQLLLEIFQVSTMDEIKVYHFSDEEWAHIDKIVADRYSNWDWTYGKNRNYDNFGSKRFASGTIEVHLSTDGGVISEAKITGDFFGFGELADVEEVLVGLPLNRAALTEKFNEIDLTHYFGPITQDEWVDFLLSI